MDKKTQVSWMTSEIKILRGLTVEQGMSAALADKSGLLPRHSRNGISVKMSELGLGNPKFRERVRNARRMSRSERVELRTFLKTEGRRMPSSDVAEKLGIRVKSVMYYRRRLGFKLPSRLRFSSRLFRETHRHVLAKLQSGRNRYWEKFWENRRAQLMKQLEKDASHNCIAPFRQCKSCGERWPGTVKYFYRGGIYKDGILNLKTHCRACGKGLWGKKIPIGSQAGSCAVRAREGACS